MSEAATLGGDHDGGTLNGSVATAAISSRGTAVFRGIGSVKRVDWSRAASEAVARELSRATVIAAKHL